MAGRQPQRRHRRGRVLRRDAGGLAPHEVPQRGGGVRGQGSGVRGGGNESAIVCDVCPG